jgi:hypothetical protein
MTAKFGDNISANLGDQIEAISRYVRDNSRLELLLDGLDERISVTIRIDCGCT